MNEFPTLFPALADLIEGSNWLNLINWVFWFLLVTVAAGGIICAIIGKGSLINRGIAGTLSIVMLYLSAVAIYILFPATREALGELPFLSVGSQQIVLLDPLSLDLRMQLCPLLFRFLILAFLVNTMEHAWPNGAGFWTWLLWRIVAMCFALVFYIFISVGIEYFFPSLFGKWAFVPLVLYFGGALIILIGKIIFSVLFSIANPIFGAVYGFFTINQMGNLFTKTLLTCVLSIGLLFWLNHMGLAALPYSNFEGLAFLPVFVMFLVALYIFGKVFSDKK